jgi:hypothetical protein
VFIGAAVALVFFRSVVATLFEGFYFDSDQAIVGLMARHVATLHRFPLYYYGLNYLLGVQAWIIAPFFWLFRPSVAVMRMPLVLLNAAVVVALMVTFTRRLRLSPAVAFVATLPLIMPTPAVSSHLIEAAGASIEPFVYVLLLWRLRAKPLAFGALLAFGFLHREFTIFALPAVVFVEAASGELWNWGSIRRAAWVAAGFGLVWLIVDDLKMHLSGAPLALQVVSLGQQVCAGEGLSRRAASVVLRALPALFGGLHAPLSAWRMNTPIEAGHAAIAWLVGVTLIVIVGRLAINRDPARRADPDQGFGPYLAWVGLFAACAYPLSCNVVYEYAPILRYILLALLLPVGLFAAFMAREQSPLLRTLVASVFVLWAAVNFVDNARLVVASVRQPPDNERRVLADYLTSRHVRYATAIYWDAYVVDFLSQERVIVASSDTIRIPEYQDEVEAHARDSVNLGRLPCAGYDTVASWCVQHR